MNTLDTQKNKIQIKKKKNETKITKKNKTKKQTNKQTKQNKKSVYIYIFIWNEVSLYPKEIHIGRSTE